MRANAPFLIVETGSPVTELRRHGGFGHWIRVASGLPAADVVFCHVERGEALPDPESWSGVLISGSAAMVTERRDWSETTASWLRTAVRSTPVFGICYGHQLLAHAHGGRVADNPAGREMGSVLVECTAAARDDALLGGIGQCFVAQSTHLQTVLEPPPDAVVLARSAQDGCKAFRLGAHAWGVQFHPEFSTTHMRGYIQARRDALHREGRDALAMHREVRPAPQARRLLRRFVALARARR